MTRTAAQKEKAKQKVIEKQKRLNKTRRGSRGKGSKERSNARQLKKFRKLIWGKRVAELKLRTASGFGSSIGPAIGVNEHRKLAKGVYSLCTNEYYAEYDFEKPLVEVRTSANVSNPEGKPDGGAGLFALRDIVDGTRICPYVGRMRSRPCPDDVHCEYDLRIDERVYVCAREVPYDVGYLLYQETDRETGSHNAVRESAHRRDACPRNFGRYINTLSEQQRGEGRTFNAIFDASEDGHDVVWVTADRDISAGEEVLVDYGKDFQVSGALGRDRYRTESDEEGTVVDDDDEWDEVEVEE